MSSIIATTSKKETDFLIVPPLESTFLSRIAYILLFYIVLAFVFCSFLSPFQTPFSRSGIIESSKGTYDEAGMHAFPCFSSVL